MKLMKMQISNKNMKKTLFGCSICIAMILVLFIILFYFLYRARLGVPNEDYYKSNDIIKEIWRCAKENKYGLKDVKCSYGYGHIRFYIEIYENSEENLIIELFSKVIYSYVDNKNQEIILLINVDGNKSVNGYTIIPNPGPQRLSPSDANIHLP